MPSEPEPAPWTQPQPFLNLEELLDWAGSQYEPKPAPIAAPASAVPASAPASAPAAGAPAPAPTPEAVELATSTKLELTQRGKLTLATLTPPQTLDRPSRPTNGAHCLVIDVSFSMEDLTTVTSDDGDKVNHGFTVLDIAKHACCTYVASLDEGDWVCVACYASEARMIIEWTQCTAEGKEALFGAIRALVEEGSTNLTAGIATGFRAFEEGLPPPVAARPSDYALLLAVATDGQPSSGTHPPGGPTGYAQFVKDRSAVVAAAHGRASVPVLVAIGLGNDLDSRLLSSFSDTFLHIPDPGSVGSFMVNLLAATRATARVRTTSGGASDADAATSVPAASTAANLAVLSLSPASAIASVPGHCTELAEGDQLLVTLGSMMYDQPRHLLIVGKEGAPPLTAQLAVNGNPAAECAAAVPAKTGDSAFEAEVGRTAAVCALELQEARLSVVDELGAPEDQVAARLKREGGRFGDVTVSLLWNDQSDLDLHVTLPSGEEIFYSHKKSRCGLAELDIDMNAGGAKSKEPVENVYMGDVEKGIEAPLGRYKVEVHNYAYHSDEGLPEPRDIPFTVSVRMHGDQMEYSGVCTRSKHKVTVVEFEYTGRLATASEHTDQLQQTKRRQLAEKARLRGVPPTLLQQAAELLPVSPLKQTLLSEALLAIQPAKFKTWGRHYLVTLPQMLRAERRSNFRDAALQAFGSDAAGRPAFFDKLASEAEECFAMLAPPKPSGLERLARQQAAASEEGSRARAAAGARTHYDSMPQEFMRGGGCFAPDALLRCVGPDGSECNVPISAVQPGSSVRTASGGTAAVRCVVVSPCAGGAAVMSQLPSGLCLTEWHPLMDQRGEWRFPIMLGRQVTRRIPAVYNLVLTAEHVAIVGGVPCATLGHGIEGPVVGPPFWGTSAVIDLLKQHEGWAAGHCVLSEPLRAR